MRCNGGKNHSEEHRRKISKALNDKKSFYIYMESIFWEKLEEGYQTLKRVKNFLQSNTYYREISYIMKP